MLLALLLAAQCAWADTLPPAPAMLLAGVYAEHVDVTQYWVSEKYDGVRAQWDGKRLRFRGGGVVAAPAWFTEGFPATALDGELWIARDQFDALSGTVRKLDDFSARVQQMQTLAAHAGVPWLQAVEQSRVADRAELMRRLDAVVKAGGEGLMLHRADAPYLTGRSDVLLKLKPWQDAEAVVVGYKPGKGKYQDMTGALEMEMPDGRRFHMGSGLSDALRRQPPPIGTRITYRYQHLTKNGMPRFPRYLRVRPDL
ncbi:MAG: DNA ligase [Hydrogenophilales bacterium 32-62-9]|nr:MAG: DNA ligase [Hydrogenophilales bacterium 32-62-9]